MTLEWKIAATAFALLILCAMFTPWPNDGSVLDKVCASVGVSSFVTMIGAVIISIWRA